MKNFDVEPTAQVIDEMSERAQALSGELGRIAERMRKQSNFEYATDAQSAILAYVMNARLDLLLTRPLREFMKGE